MKKAYPWIWQRHYVHESHVEHAPKILWFNRHGEIMQSSSWSQYQTRNLGYMVEVTEGGKVKRMLALFNASPTPLSFKLPYSDKVPSWSLLLDTSSDESLHELSSQAWTGHYPMLGFSTVVLLDSHNLTSSTRQESLL